MAKRSGASVAVAGIDLELPRGSFAAALLGHIDLDTTRGYTAVFQDELIARHQQFITRRRALRDSAEYRDVTADEWAEFEKHFQLRRVALGDCFRPYATPCVHEQTCIRCPHLRLDPAQEPLLDDIENNTHARLAEAKDKQWLGEVAALEETLHHITRKRHQFPRSAVTESADDELWFMGEGHRRPAGLIDASSGSHLLLGLGEATQVGITVEPKGGSKQPTSNPVFAVDVQT